MSLFVLDTDTLTLYRYGHPQVTGLVSLTTPRSTPDANS
jgi:hypothetical protein